MAQIYSEMTNQILDELHKVVVGKDSVLIWMLGAILAGGHILLEGIPGVEKPRWRWPIPKCWGWTMAVYR